MRNALMKNWALGDMRICHKRKSRRHISASRYDENLTSKELCKVLLQFDEMYEEMTDLERKEFLNILIERIDLYPERQEDGRILKRIRFKFRVDYDAEDGGKVLLNENDVETICLLTHNS